MDQYHQLSSAQRIDQLETVVGMMYVALSRLAQQHRWVHQGGQSYYLITEAEQQECRRARMFALRTMADANATLPAIQFSVPTVPLYPPRPSAGPLTSPFTFGLDDGSDPRTPTPTRPR